MLAKRKNYQTHGLFFTLKGYIMVKNLLAKSGSLCIFQHIFGARGQTPLPGPGA